MNSRYSRCPMCKVDLTHDDLFVEYVNENKKNQEPKPKKKDKKNVLIEMIQNISPEQKMIVFSEYDETFYNLLKEFNTMKKIAILKGRVESQMKILENFKKGEIQIIFMNAVYCGAGLNIEMATDIVIYHKLSNTMEKQVIGRAQRPGRTCALKVSYLMYDDEMPESQVSSQV